MRKRRASLEVGKVKRRLQKVKVNGVVSTSTPKPRSKYRLKVQVNGIKTIPRRLPPLKIKTNGAKPKKHSSRRLVRIDIPHVALGVLETSISVLISAYHSAHWLPAAVRSILGQTLSPGLRLELLIGVDGCPETWIVAERLARKDSRVRAILMTTNEGTYRVLNRLLRESTGDLIAILDSDDVAVNGRLDTQAHVLLNSNSDLVGSRYQVGNSTLTNIKSGPDLEIGDAKQAFVSKNYHSFPTHSTWMVRRTLYESLGGYHPARCGSDVDFYLRALAAGAATSVLSARYIVRRQHRNQLTAQGNKLTGPGSRERITMRQRIRKDWNAYLNGAAVRKEKMEASTVKSEVNTNPSQEFWVARYRSVDSPIRAVGRIDHSAEENKQSYADAATVFARMVENDLPKDRSSMSVLDLGYGLGHYARLCKQLGFGGYLGLDFVGAHVEVDGYQFMKLDITQPLAFDRTFDLVLAIDVGYHIINDMKFRQLLVNIKKLTRGWAYITDLFISHHAVAHVKHRPVSSFSAILGKPVSITPWRDNKIARFVVQGGR